MIETITMGSSPQLAQLVIWGDDYISGLHCRITRVPTVTRPGPARLWIEDLGSLNGTLINGHRVYGKTELLIGDRLKIGHTERELPPFAFWVD